VPDKGKQKYEQKWLMISSVIYSLFATIVAVEASSHPASPIYRVLYGNGSTKKTPLRCAAVDARGRQAICVQSNSC
jgi:hypothetical protein